MVVSIRINYLGYGIFFLVWTQNRDSYHSATYMRRQSDVTYILDDVNMQLTSYTRCYRSCRFWKNLKLLRRSERYVDPR